MDQQKRPSVYLCERCENLERVLDFFHAPQVGQMPGINERLVVFLTQLGFWEWELDNLIYAITSFAERARAWEGESGPALVHGLRNRGIYISFVAVKDLKEKRQLRHERVRQVVAPIEQLNRVIGLWNRLIDACEERILVPADERRKVADMGVQVHQDLSQFRRPVVPLTEENGNNSG